MWRSCERMGILPPGMLGSYDELNVQQQADLIAYNQVREHEENEREELALKVASAGRMRL